MLFIVFLFAAAECAISTDVVGTKLTISGTGPITQSNVRAKGDYALITNIVINTGPTVIKAESFYLMRKLETIHFSSTIEYLEDNVFYQCFSLRSFFVDKENVFLYTDGESLYSSNKTILYNIISKSADNNITFDPKLERIVGRSLSSIKANVILFPKSLKTVGKAILIHSSCNEVQFEPESQLLTLPSHIYYYSISKVIHISPTVVTISSDAFLFSSCTTIIFDEIENSMCTTLSPRAFSGATKCTTIILPPKITEFPEDCFKSLPITSINIPRDCSSISSDAFSTCTQLSRITIDEGNKHYKLVGSTLYNKDETQLLFVPQSTNDISISASIEDISSTLLQSLVNVDSINVSADNNNFSGEDGCLYSKNFSSLICVCGGVKFLYININTTTIEENACFTVGIESVTFRGRNVSKIMSGAFKQCTKLRSFDFIDSIKEVHSEAFSSSGIRTISLKNVTLLGDYCFQRTAVSSVYISSSVVSFGIGIFSYCGDIEDIQFEESTNISTITNSMFHSCGKEGTTFVIPKSVKHISKSAFYSSKFNISFHKDSQLTDIQESAFESSYIEELCFPSTVRSIGMKAFGSCKKINSVSFKADSNLSTIMASAFISCPSLERFSIPPTLSNLDPTVFFECFKLSTVTGRNYDSILCVESNMVYNSDFTQLIVCPPGLVTASVRYSVASISSNAFYNCQLLTNVIFSPPSYLETLDDNSPTKHCTSLSVVSFTKGSKLEVLGDNTFKGCISLKSIDFGNPSNFKAIGASAFEGCSNLTQIEVPSTVKHIGSNCFQNTSLTGASFGSVLTIDSAAFAYCVFLESAKLSSISSISDSLFEGCSNLRSISFPSKISSSCGFEFGCRSFAGCSFISFTVPSGVKLINRFVFEKCSGLETINISGSVSQIGDGCFNECRSLTMIIYCGRGSINSNCGITGSDVIAYVPQGYLGTLFCNVVANPQLNEECAFLPPTPSFSAMFTINQKDAQFFGCIEFSEALSE